MVIYSVAFLIPARKLIEQRKIDMFNWKEIIQDKTFRYIDQTEVTTFQNKPFSAQTSFAIDDMLAESVSAGTSYPSVRLWSHPNTVVLGIVDGRLPFLKEGVRFLQDAGQQIVIRNSGGLAVALDEGVLNMSLIIPDMKHISIYEAYEAMVQFVRYMMRDVTDDIKAFEIVGSYCPGDYDLSIDGKKFAGISQRRIKDSAAVQIYMDVAGSSKERANLIKHFYVYAKKNTTTPFTYPDVDPQTMASLSELLQTDITVTEMKNRVQSALEVLATSITTKPFTNKEIDIFTRRFKQMEKRNEIISSIL